MWSLTPDKLFTFSGSPKRIQISFKVCPTMLPVMYVLLTLLSCASADSFLDSIFDNNTAPGLQLRGLEEKLFRNYNKRLVPVRNGKARLNVSLSLHIQQLELDEVEQTMTVHGYLGMRWKDEYLNFSSHQNNGIEKFHIPLWYIWKPDISLYNSASGKDDHHVSSEYPAWVQSTGHVTLYPPVTFKASCVFNFTDFPHDVQTCPVIIGSFRNGLDKLDFVHSQSGARVVNAWNGTKSIFHILRHMSGWRIVQSGMRNEKRYWYNGDSIEKPKGPDSSNWAEMYFYVSVQRHQPYFGVLYILPAVATASVVLISFWALSAKIQIFMLLMALILHGIYLHGLMQNLPPTTFGLPKIVHFYGLSLCLNMLSIIYTVVSVSTLDWKGPVPRVLRSVANVYAQRTQPARPAVNYSETENSEAREVADNEWKTAMLLISTITVTLMGLAYILGAFALLT